jgi:hypothetical protein
MLIQDDMNPEIQMYYVMEDGINQLIKVVDLNCNECGAPGAHSIIDTNPPLPPCAEQ